MAAIKSTPAKLEEKAGEAVRSRCLIRAHVGAGIEDLLFADGRIKGHELSAYRKL